MQNPIARRCALVTIATLLGAINPGSIAADPPLDTCPAAPLDGGLSVVSLAFDGSLTSVVRASIGQPGGPGPVAVAFSRGVATLPSWGARFGVAAVEPWDIDPGHASVEQVTAVDLDGDGVDELLVRGFSSTFLYCLTRGADGTWRELWSLRDFMIRGPIRTRPGGGRSLIVETFLPGTDHIQMAEIGIEADGSLGAVTPIVEPAAFSAWWVVLVDLDGDEQSDLLARDDTSFVAWTAESDGTWSAPFTPALDGGQSVIAVPEVADLDADGFDDLVFPKGSSIELHLGRPGGGFDVMRVTSDVPIERVTSGDLDGDGDLDVLGTSGFGMSVFEQRSDRTFVHGPTLPIRAVQQVVLEDRTQDGRLDIVAGLFPDAVVHRGIGLIGWGTRRWPGAMRQSALEVGRGALWPGAPDPSGHRTVLAITPEGTLQLGAWDPGLERHLVIDAVDLGPEAFDVRPTVDSGAASGRALIARRLSNAEGVVVPVHASGGRLIVGPPIWEGPAAGLTPPVAIEGDFDGDGALDAAIAIPGEARVLIRWRRGDRLVDGPDLMFDGSARTLLADDLDGDGTTDLVVTTVANSVFVHYGDPEEPLADIASVPGVPVADRALVSVDWDGDGRRELVGSAFGAQLIHAVGEDRLRLAAVAITDVEGGIVQLRDLAVHDDQALGGRWIAHSGIGGGSTFRAEIRGPVTAPTVRVRRMPWSLRTHGRHIVDMDGDGRLDLLTGTRGHDEPERGWVTVLFGEACGPTCPGELDGDGVITFRDLLLQLGSPDSATSRPELVHDLDGDGDRDSDDTIVLLSNWGLCAPPGP